MESIQVDTSTTFSRESNLIVSVVFMSEFTFATTNQKQRITLLLLYWICPLACWEL